MDAGTIVIMVIVFGVTIPMWACLTADDLIRSKEPHGPFDVLGRMLCQALLFGMILLLALMFGGCGEKILVPY